MDSDQCNRNSAGQRDGQVLNGEDDAAVAEAQCGAGPITIDVTFEGNKASGKMSMNGQDKPIAVDLGGPVFADAAGADQVLACLPLAEGYTTTFRNFDLQAQKVRLMQLNVGAIEKVTVPAGTFDAYKVDVTSADGGSDTKTVWVAKDSHKVVKVTAVVASMGGRKGDGRAY